jgi:RND family efflux transporter MFP subunit
MKKFLAICVVAALAGFMGWQIYQKAIEPKKRSRRGRRVVKVAVEVKPVKQALIRDVRKFTGTLQPKSQFIVAPKISGRLKRLMFNLGDRVKPGQMVAVLDDEEFLQEVDQARASLEVARANLEEKQSTLGIAKRELDRTIVLRAKKIASESELDEARSRSKTQEAKLKVAMAQVVQKESALKVAEVRLSYTRIRVPPNKGKTHRVVGERYVHEGALLAPNKAIISIIDIRSVIAAIHVIERDYANIQIGMEAVVATDAFPNRTFTGKVVRIAPLLKETSRQAKVEVEIDNPKKLLKPGMFVKVQIEFDRHDHTTVVPREALIKHLGEQGVFVADVREEIARFVPVTTGIIDGRQVEILKPPLTGSVVTLGQHLLEDGAAIILPSETQKSPAQKQSPGKKKKNKKKK